MKSNTTVPVADYLELYEFKKAYDEGKKVFVRDYSGEKEYMIPVSEMDEKLKLLIAAHKEAANKLDNLEYAKSEISDLNKSVNDLKQKLFNKDKNVDQLILEKSAIEKQLKSAEKSKIFWIAAWTVLLVSLIISLLN